MQLSIARISRQMIKKRPHKKIGRASACRAGMWKLKHFGLDLSFQTKGLTFKAAEPSWRYGHASCKFVRVEVSSLELIQIISAGGYLWHPMPRW
jgi:hypothetical protein